MITAFVMKESRKVHERLAIRFKENIARLSSKTNNIHNTKNKVFR